MFKDKHECNATLCTFRSENYHECTTNYHELYVEMHVGDMLKRRKNLDKQKLFTIFAEM